ncbi:MAG: HD domain-containing protein [Clostridiales bacterium]|nr:HD domain-containing protein [Clostridiales bacterium]
MRNDILNYLQGELRHRCEQPSNRFGIGLYGHIEAVVKNGALLAERYGADKEIVMIVAWLHDIASATDYSLYQDHHIHGAEMARDILLQWNYETERIEWVQRCIRNHRGSVSLDQESVEEVCVADADAISHFDSLPSLLYLAYRERGMDFEEGRNFVKDKLERSFQKLSPRSRELYENRYRQIMDILNG